MGIFFPKIPEKKIKSQKKSQSLIALCWLIHKKSEKSHDKTAL